MYEKFAEKLNGLAAWVIRIIGTLIFLFLAWNSFKDTQYEMPGDWAWINHNVADSKSGNVLFLLVAIGLLCVLLSINGKINEKLQKIFRRGVLLASVLFTVGAGLFWVFDVVHYPIGDQSEIVNAASEFLEGNYEYLAPNQYLGMYPQQLGMVTLLEGIFHFVGAGNFRAIQVINVFLAAGVVALAYRISWLVTGNSAVSICTCVLTNCCLPLTLYTTWVYGEIPSLFFIFAACCFLLEYERKNSLWFLFGMVLTCTFAALVRKNALIFVIAVVLTGVIQAIRKKDKGLILALMFAILLPILSYQGIYKMYEIRSGYVHTEGVPSIDYLVLGVGENEGKYGRYNAKIRDVYIDAGYNADAAKPIYRELLESRLEEFKENPSYAHTFYHGKILDQWNQPMCEGIQHNTAIIGVQAETSFRGAFTVQLRDGELFWPVVNFADGIQFIVYAGMLCYFAFSIKKANSRLEQAAAVSIIGGFLFHIFWESAARYAFVYYVLMFPLAVLGYHSFLCWLLVTKPVKFLKEKISKPKTIAE